MLETAIDYNLVEGFGGSVFEPPRGPPGSSRIQTRERRPFRTVDEYACMLPYSSNWFDFFDFVGRPEWKSRYREAADRGSDIEALYAMVHEEEIKRTTAEWLEFCDGADIPCMPVTRYRTAGERPARQGCRSYACGPASHRGSLPRDPPTNPLQ